MPYCSHKIRPRFTVRDSSGEIIITAEKKSEGHIVLTGTVKMPWGEFHLFPPNHKCKSANPKTLFFDNLQSTLINRKGMQHDIAYITCANLKQQIEMIADDYIL